ncbi:MAG: hypothetical protein JRI23_05390 [Deltaproteobacteria bacterium]|jgi:hypothetical protein|nr:hypothetical protein [Deltaproteobacteria bacterium]MBW2530986.1 hypothetical protein [Deltaproteobacteria bacterium]
MAALRASTKVSSAVLALVVAGALGSCGDAGEDGPGGGDDGRCPSGQLWCDGQCISVLFDPYNCGNCGVQCAADLVCSLGECVDGCTGGTTECGGLCVDLDVDLLHCGSCGNACQTGEVCDGEGVCRLTCVSPLQACDGRCEDVATSSSHCGGCGQPCAAGRICNGQGWCDTACAAGFVACDGRCIDPLVDSAHCGASGDCLGASAGVACGATEACQDGSCYALPCEDLWELTAHTNDTENNATTLSDGTVEDCAEQQAVVGLLDGADDVDWYTYLGSDGSCIVNPLHLVEQATAPVRLCVFLECVDTASATFFTCPAGTTEATSPDGRAGCCITGTDESFELGDLSCTSSMDDSAYVYVRVDDPAATASTCARYSVRYGF